MSALKMNSSTLGKPTEKISKSPIVVRMKPRTRLSAPGDFKDARSARAAGIAVSLRGRTLDDYKLAFEVTQGSERFQENGLGNLEKLLSKQLDVDTTKIIKAIRTLHTRLDDGETALNILRSGEIENIRIKKPSGNFLYPDVRALLRAADEWADVEDDPGE